MRLQWRTTHDLTRIISKNVHHVVGNYMCVTFFPARWKEGKILNTFWSYDWQLWLDQRALSQAPSHNACPTCLCPSGVLLFKPLPPLLSAGRETKGQEEEQGLVGLGGKHPKPAGLALRWINEQSETKAAERRRRRRRVAEGRKRRDKESQGEQEEKVVAAGSVKVSVQQRANRWDTGVTKGLDSLHLMEMWWQWMLMSCRVWVRFWLWISY